jgi:electron transfer flavoprotein-quinone oxidoreductase
MEKWDVVVVGGGPGGSAAAATAAEAGLKTIFFERGRKPGEKNSSGCGLGQRWYRDYPDLIKGLEKLPSVRKVEMVVINLLDEHDRLRYRCGTTGSDLCANRWPGGMDGISIYRKDLDPYLADLAVEAGAELRTSTLVTDVVMEDGVVKGVKTDAGETFSAGVVIAADGAVSTMARKSGIRERWGGGCTLVPQLDFSADEEKMDLIIGNAEWVWFGPLYGTYQVNFRDGFHIGAGQWLRQDWDRQPLEMMRDLLKVKPFVDMCKALDAKPREYQAHLLPWLKKPGKTYGGGIMLVGDSAGFPCPLEAEGVWHAVTSGRIAAETAAWALSKGDTSERAMAEYERRWKASDLGKEFEFGPEFVDLWNSTVFDPKLMTEQIQILLEFSMLHPFSIVFDWGDAHMDCFNQHLSHMLELAPQFGDFGKTYLAPLSRGIWPSNVKTILLQVKPRIPLVRNLSDDQYFKLVARLSRGLRPWLEPGIKQDAAISREAFAGRRKK